MKTIELKISTQAELDSFGAHTMEQEADFRVLRIDPIVESLDLAEYLFSVSATAINPVCNPCGKAHWGPCNGFNRVICEGGTEPVHPDVVRNIRDQCLYHCVDFIFEGWGRWAPCPQASYVNDGNHIWWGGIDDLPGWRIGPLPRTITDIVRP